MRLEFHCKGQSIIIFIYWRICWYLPANICLLIVNGWANCVPTFLTLLKTKPNRSDPFFEQRMLFYKIYDIESYAFRWFVMKGKIKPLIIPFCVCIILQNEIILLDFTLKALISIIQITTLKSWLKLTTIPTLIDTDLLIIFRIVVCGMIKWKNWS